MNLLDKTTELLIEVGLMERDEDGDLLIHYSGHEHRDMIEAYLVAAGRLDRYDEIELESFEGKNRDRALINSFEKQGKKVH